MIERKPTPWFTATFARNFRHLGRKGAIVTGTDLQTLQAAEKIASEKAAQWEKAARILRAEVAAR